ncbi:MAG: hypothetical protein ACOCWU_03210 [Spirochaetota bacterium]
MMWGRTARSAAAVLTVVVSLVAVPMPSARANASSVDAALSRLYVDYAYRAFEDGRTREAERLAETAAEFAEENADAHHILALIRRQRAAPAESVVESLERALRYGNFRATEERDARMLLAETFLRVDRPEDALSVIEAPSEEPVVSDAAARFLRARALFALDRVAEAQRETEGGRRLYPEDPRFFLLQLREDPMPGPQAGRWLDEHRSEHPAYLEALLYYARRLTDADRRMELVERYLALGGTDPRIAVVWAGAARDGEDPAESAAAWRQFVRMDGLGDKSAVEEIFELLPDGETRDRAQRVLAGYDGTSVRDEERTGYPRERFEFEDGAVVRWRVDEDQDGRAELEVDLENRVPQRVSPTPEGYRLEYGSYPEVSWVEVTGEEERRLYRIRPGHAVYPILDDEIDWGSQLPDAVFPYPRAEEYPPLSESFLRRRAYRVEFARGSGPVTRVRTLDEGEVVREVRDGEGDGRIDHVIAYKNGRPSTGVRDADRDGRFEVFEEYEEGELAVLFVDATGDGAVDYTEDLGPERGRQWDVNGNGIMDAQEFRAMRQEILGGLDAGDRLTDDHRDERRLRQRPEERPGGEAPVDETVDE